MFLVICAPTVSAGAGLSDAWSDFDRSLSIFDPAGDYVSQPIEKAIPALSFKGFFRQWSDINLHRNQKVGFRNKDFRFLQLQNLLEIELHYQFTDNLELTSINHFLYDGVYNWQDSGGLFAPACERNRPALPQLRTYRARTLHQLSYAQLRYRRRQAANCLGENGWALYRHD